MTDRLEFSQRTITLLCLSALTIMMGTAITAALPGIAAEFAGQPNALLLTQLVLTLPALFVFLIAPWAGVITDRFGRRPVLLFSTLLYALAGTTGLYLDSLWGILVGRALLGMATAGVMTAATALAGDYFSGQARSHYMGLQATFANFGGVLFLFSSGFLAELSWRMPFAIYGIALILLPFAFKVLPEPVATRHESGDAPAPGVLREHLRLSPLYALGALFFIAFYLVPTQLPFHLQAMGVEGPRFTGIATGLFSVASATVSVFFGRIGRLAKPPLLFAIAFLLMATGFTIACFARDYTVIIIAMIVGGTGMGVFGPSLFSTTISAALPQMRGRVSGALTSAIFFGQFVSPVVTYPFVATLGVAWAFLVMATLLALVALVSFVVWLRQRTGGEGNV